MWCDTASGIMEATKLQQHSTHIDLPEKIKISTDSTVTKIKLRWTCSLSLAMKVLVVLSCLYVMYLITYISEDMTRIRIYEQERIKLQKLLFNTDFDLVASDKL